MTGSTQRPGPRLSPGTVLFCDIRGFTRLLEDMAPAAAFGLIERFLVQLTGAIVAEGGTVNNLTGDGFLAHFDEAHAGDNHALRALNAAITLRARLRELNRDRHEAHAATIAIGVGINSGLLAAGTVRIDGQERPLLIGDVVNLAARIESLTKEFSVDILLSDETYASTRGFGTFLTMPPRAVRGRTEKLVTYWVPPFAKPIRSAIASP